MVNPTIENGYFQVDGKRLWPIGFNTWPSATGIGCWDHFDLSEWQTDFRAIKASGYNTVRLFLLWETFQPREDHVDSVMLERLKQVCVAAAGCDLWVIPTLFQGWMSGMNHDPAWRAGRNHIKDPQMRQAMCLLASQVGQTLHDCPKILAIDLANEIDLVQGDVDSSSLVGWTSDLRDAIRKKRPGTLVTNGDAGGAWWGPQRWNYEDPRLDFLCLHGYPIFGAPVPTGRLGEVHFSLVFGAVTAFARAFGPVMREEYGSAMGGDGEHIAGYTRAASLASYLGGANGFLHWAWRDFTNTQAPYQREPFETSMGYVNADLSRKQWSHGFDEFRDLINRISDYTPAPSDVAIYLPSGYRRGSSTAIPGLMAAYVNLVANGITPDVSRSISDKYKLLVIPHTDLSIYEIGELTRYVEAGGRVIATNVSFRVCSHHWERATATRHIDLYRAFRPAHVCCGERVVPITCPEAGLTIPVLAAIDASVTIAGSDGDVPHVLVSTRGAGRIVQCVPPLEGALKTDVDENVAGLWGDLTRLAGYEPKIRQSDIGCQTGIIADSQGRRAILVVNHRGRDVKVTVNAFGQDFELNIAAKDFAMRDIASTR